MPASSFDGGVTRRDALRLAAGSVIALASGLLPIGCGPDPVGVGESHEEGGRLLVPGSSTPTTSLEPGLHALGLETPRDGWLLVPAGYRADRPTPLVVTFHGAGGSADAWIAAMRPYADRQGFLLLAPDSREVTWDAALRGFGADVTFLDNALKSVFARVAVDPQRMALQGFSDGASYALSLGVANGDAFGHVVAFSPGFIADSRRHGRASFFVSHGTRDQILPIDQASRKLVPELRDAGFEVDYHEFDGPHAVPGDIAAAAFDWLASAWG